MLLTILQLPDSEPAVLQSPSAQLSSSSNTSVGAVSSRASSPPLGIPCSNEAHIIATIGYPAPLPSFSRPITQVLTEGSKSKVMLLYSDIIKEACAGSVHLKRRQPNSPWRTSGKQLLRISQYFQWRTTRTPGHTSMTSCHQLYGMFDVVWSANLHHLFALRLHQHRNPSELSSQSQK